MSGQPGDDTGDAERQAFPDGYLAALRWDWGEAYRIGHDDVRGWWATRRDGLGGDITAPGPDELQRAILEDYGLKPVPRGLTFRTPS